MKFHSVCLLAVFSPGIELFSRIRGLALLALACYLVSNGAIVLEAFLLLFFYTTLPQMSVAQLIRLLAAAQNEFVALKHLSAFFSESVEMEEASSVAVVPECSSKIELRGVTFGYPGGRKLYRDAEMTVPARSITVVQGESGSGKSTFINLLLRFHAPEKGRISIRGIDMGVIPRRELREKIGEVSQQHFIFHESLRDNLRIAKPDATEDEILQALERAHLGDFAIGLPMGIDTKMDPRGKGISAGERQRICLARLMLRKSPIMILDEPWSDLDGRARRLLAEVLNSCRADATILILTHEPLEDLNVDLFCYLDGAKGVFSMAGSAPARE